MQANHDLTLRVSPDSGKITVEEHTGDVISRKEITPRAFFDCIKGSIRHTAYPSGLLPPDCLAVSLGEQDTGIVVRYSMDWADISFYETPYPHFPLPRLVFGYHVDPQGKAVRCRMGVMEDEIPRPETPMYFYPFSNVSDDGHLCIGMNALPKYKGLHKTATLPALLLSIPNALDRFDQGHNRLDMEYRDLLEHLKDKTPAYYYDEVLVRNGKTLQDFISGN